MKHKKGFYVEQTSILPCTASLATLSGKAYAKILWNSSNQGNENCPLSLIIPTNKTLVRIKILLNTHPIMCFVKNKQNKTIH